MGVSTDKGSLEWVIYSINRIACIVFIHLLFVNIQQMCAGGAGEGERGDTG